jgi:hypothetical protein
LDAVSFAIAAACFTAPRHQPRRRVAPRKPRGGCSNLHIGDLELDRLVVAEPMAERRPFPT